jgi:S1-C subfamily serine protease
MAKTLVCLAAMISVVALTGNVIAQSELDQRDLVLPTPGESKSFSSDAPTIDSLSPDIGSTIAAGAAFLKEYKTNESATRGLRNIEIFREAAPAVVVVLTNDGLGSGSLLDNGTILTNWHVVSGKRQVNVLFKPADPNGNLLIKT